MTNLDHSPNQNHLLELKLAAFAALDYTDIWKLFGEGKHPAFTKLLINNLSPHLSSQAFDYWLHKGPRTFATTGPGLYHTGGSRHALKLISWLATLLGIRSDVARLCTAETLAEQREIWTKRVRRVMLSQFLAHTVIGSERFLWKALGVPANQRAMIEQDYVAESVSDGSAGSELSSTVIPNSPGNDGVDSGTTTSATTAAKPKASNKSGQAIWSYAVNTLDPVVQNTLVSADNHYYLLCLQGHYTAACHPAYLSRKAHAKLSAPGAFDGLRIHTDELNEVFARMAPATLTIAVLMDSMDWFNPGGQEAPTQIRGVNRALVMGGRVLLRSAGLLPWYIAVFEQGGFVAKRVAARVPLGSCIDR